MNNQRVPLSHWRAKKLFAEFREHWGVFVDGHLVDCSTEEYDAELRSCSLCECRDILVTVRHCRPYVTVAGVKRWQIDDLRIYPLDGFLEERRRDKPEDDPSSDEDFGSDWQPA